CYIFFFQAEDGIRDRNVTGVQTCALPISFSHSLLKIGISLTLLLSSVMQMEECLTLGPDNRTQIEECLTLLSIFRSQCQAYQKYLTLITLFAFQCHAKPPIRYIRPNQLHVKKRNPLFLRITLFFSHLLSSKSTF